MIQYHTAKQCKTSVPSFWSVFYFQKKILTFKVKFCGIQVLLIIFMYENLYFYIESQLIEAIPDR